MMVNEPRERICIDKITMINTQFCVDVKLILRGELFIHHHALTKTANYCFTITIIENNNSKQKLESNLYNDLNTSNGRTAWRTNAIDGRVMLATN